MKKSSVVIFIFTTIMIFTLCGCAGQANYLKLAKEHDFLYFFPRAASSFDFDTLDEAYDYIRTAQAKFATSANKPLAKGVPGKLSGPEMVLEKPVRVFYYLQASSDRTINLDTSGNVEQAIRDARSATVVFLVFYESRAISLASYYLQSGWVYNTANQHTYFPIGSETFDVEYPVMWSNEKAFRYLRGETD